MGGGGGVGHSGARFAAAVQGKLPWSGALAGTGWLLSAGTKVPQFSPLKSQKPASSDYCQSL